MTNDLLADTESSSGTHAHPDHYNRNMNSAREAGLTHAHERGGQAASVHTLLESGAVEAGVLQLTAKEALAAALAHASAAQSSAQKGGQCRE